MTLTFHNGIAHWQGKPRFLITAEYPYFRDDRTHWESKLLQIKGLGVEVVSTYIPWRHHELIIDGERRYDFWGNTAPNRDVVGFIALCQRLGLKLVVKPGPFCHAELNYGGLPDFVCPLNRPDIEPLLNAEGKPVTWQGSASGPDGKPQPWPLPSPHSEAYRNEVERWFEALRCHVLADACGPDGTVIAVQVGNEGIYCDAQAAVWNDDYSASGIAAFRKWLQQKYPSLKEYNLQHGTLFEDWSEVEPPRRFVEAETLMDLRAYADWSEFRGYDLGATYAEYARLLNLPVPAVANVNPAADAPWGVDAWLSRVQPALWGPVNYGYTNWIGPAVDNPSAMARYLLMTRLAPGVNMEENWGFAQSPNVCLQQTLLQIAGGSTGYNIYTVAGTDSWDEAIDRFQSRPYPSHAPISANGTVTPKGEAIRRLNRFFQTYGAEFLECQPYMGVAWGFYLPYSYVGAWTGGASSEIRIEDHPLRPTGPTLIACQQALMEQGVDMGFVDLQRASLAELRTYPVIVMPGMPFMDAATQAKLAAYVRSGGILVVIGEVPTLDEYLEPCDLLLKVQPNQYQDVKEAAKAIWFLAGKPFVGTKPIGDGFAWARFHPDKDVYYLVVLSRDTGHPTVRCTVAGRECTVVLTMAPRGGAVVRMERSTPVAALIAGENEALGRSVRPSCQVDNSAKLLADAPGDFLKL